VDGYASLMFYLITYLFMNLGAFAAATLFTLKTGSDDISAFSGLWRKDPFLAVCLSVFLLSLAGIPPFAGFFGKIYLFWAAFQAGAYTLLFVGLVTSVASMYYYLRVVKPMVVRPMSPEVEAYPATNWELPGMRSLQVALGVSVVATVIVGIISNPIVSLMNESIARTPPLQTAKQLSQK